MAAQRKPLMLLPLIGALLLGVVAGFYLVASRREAKRASSSKIVRHKVESNPEGALKYWTADRMRNAKAAPMPHVSEPGQGDQPPSQPSKDRP